MKKLIVSLLVLLLLAGCNAEPTKLSDGEILKQQYEGLNGKLDEGGIKYSTISLTASTNIRLAQKEDVEELFLRGTHVVYLGWPSCGWCRRAVPVLIDTVDEYSGINLYVFDIKEARDDFQAGKQTELAEIYQLVCQAIEYSELDFSSFERFEDGTLRLPSSAVYFVKNGVVSAIHTRTVGSHLNAFEPLNESQQAELKDIYRGYLDDIVRNNNPGCGDCD